MSSVFEDILKERGTSLSDMDLASRKAVEAESRRYEAARWLRRTVGVVGARELPEEPSEEEFRLALRSGLILCSAINMIQPAAVPKIVLNPGDSLVIQDGAALSAYQYFENVRNFLVAAQDISLPTFDVSDLEQGGQSSRIVNCILALKSYSEWRQMGGGGSWKFGGNVKPTVSVKAFMRKNLGPFSNSFTRSQSLDAREKNCDEQCLKKVESHEMSSPLKVFVNSILLEKKPEEVPMLVELILGKFMEEFERRIANQNELVPDSLPFPYRADNEVARSAFSSRGYCEVSPWESLRSVSLFPIALAARSVFSSRGDRRSPLVRARGQPFPDRADRKVARSAFYSCGECEVSPLGEHAVRPFPVVGGAR
ncbi:Kinesin-4 [Platanthera zijinensis]|uniref:Kinesin-4 n=1 Tax=Platanthera zijinensis TaxID=2320716 RepID=A0AAP0BRT5_9ASPA